MRNGFCYLNTKILIVFIYHTIKYTPQNRLIWTIFVIISNTSFWIKKVTILQFSKNISDISLQILHLSHLLGQNLSWSSTTHLQYWPNCSLFTKYKYSLLALWKYKLNTGERFPSSQVNLSHSDWVPIHKESWQQIKKQFCIIYVCYTKKYKQNYSSFFHKSIYNKFFLRTISPKVVKRLVLLL